MSVRLSEELATSVRLRGVIFHIWCTGTEGRIEMAKEMAELRYTAKDSVFRSLFSDLKYLLQLYQTLHPEDKTTTEADLNIETLERLLYNGQYNDLGFSVKDKLLVLVEAQSTWSLNILIRCFLYLAQTYHDYFMAHDVNLLQQSPKIQMPVPELYVVYLGEKGDRPDTLSLQKEYFGGRDCSIEVKAKIIYADGSGSIIDQYIIFCRVLKEQVKIHGRTRKAIEETIRICMDQNILKEYFEKHESEAVTIMMALFDQERLDQFKYNEAIGIGRDDIISKLLLSGAITRETAARTLGISDEEFKTKYSSLQPIHD